MLPGFHVFPTRKEMSLLIVILDLLVPFACVHETKWFKESIKLLEGKRGDNGLCRFPRDWLSDDDISKWPEGLCMNLEKALSDDALAYDSTFRVLRIKSYL